MKSLFYSEYRAKNSTRVYLFTLFICCISMIGCSSAPTFIKSDFKQKRIKSIAIMPVIDKRNIVEETDKTHESLTNIEELLTKKITSKNYDVLSPGTVKNILKEKVIDTVTPENLCTILKVDGILYSELFNYNDVFFINHSIKMQFKFYDAKGDSLWINNLDDSDKPFLSAICSTVGWAIGLSLDNKITSKDKLPRIIAGVVASELVYIIVDGISNETSQSIDGVFTTLPNGKYCDKENIK